MAGSDLKNGHPAKMRRSILRSGERRLYFTQLRMASLKKNDVLSRRGFVRRSRTRYTRNVPVRAPATNRGRGKWYSPAYTIGQRFGADVPPWVDLEKECYMPIQFRCSNCGAAFNAPESMAGSQARCNGCGAIVVVPGLIPVASEASQWSEAPADFDPNQRSTKPGLPKIEEVPAFVWFLLAGGAFVLFFLTVGITLVMDAGSSVGEDPVARRPEGASISPSGATAPSTPTTPNKPTQPRSANSPVRASVVAGSFPIEPSEPVPSSLSPPPDRTGVKLGIPSSADSTNDPIGSASPAAASVAWGGGDADGELRIPVDDAHVTFGPSGCPVVVVGNRVWGLGKGELVQELKGGYRKHGQVRTALSANGRWFAAQESSKDGRDHVSVWNTTTGEKSATVDAGKEHTVEYFSFSLDKYLVTGGRGTTQLQVWDAASGRAMKPIDTPCDRIKQGNIAFTSDGQYFAVVDDKHLVVLKTKSKRVVAVMASPKKIERSNTGQSVIVRNNRVVADTRRATGTESIFIFAWLQAMQFSPDNQELAAVSTHPRPRLMCWSNRGKLAYDEPLDQLPRMAFWKHSVQWLPDRSGWVVSGSVIDRETKRIVLGVRQQFGSDMHVYALDKNRLLGAFPHNPDELEVMEIPWDQIRTSLKLLEEGAPALLSPAQPVSAHVKLTGLRGDQSETTRIIGEALEKRLARDGLRIAPDQKTYFQLRFSEEAGDQLPIYERQSPFDFRGRDTGRTATEAKGALIVELISGQEVLWRDALTATSSTSFSEAINDASVRKSMLQTLSFQIAELNFPYFIPTSKDNVALPVVIE